MLPSSLTAQSTITVSNAVAGTTPTLLGYNLGHLTEKGNGFDWFRYSGVKGARIFFSASELQSQTSPGRTVVTSEAAFWDTIGKARNLGTSKSTYIRWSDFNYDYTSTSGNNDITFQYTLTQLRGIGVEILANITASPTTFPITSASDWAGKWELWQHYYAQAYLLARDYDIRRFSMFNEPNNWSGMTEADWFQRLRICSDAIQRAIADVNAATGKNLTPRIYAPNTANGKEKYNTAADTWGRDTIVNRFLQLSGLTNSVWTPKTTALSWRLSHVYNYQKYSMQTDDGNGLTGYLTDLNALKDLIAADLTGEALPPIALTEYNVRTGATYDTKTENQDTPSDYVALAANSIALASNGAEELFLFKFGQTDSGGVNYGVAKNGTHYVQNASGSDNNYGGATKSAEVYRLFHKAAQGGRQRYAFSASSGAASSTTSGLWTLVTRDVTNGFFYFFLANKDTNPVALELNLSSLNLPNGLPVVLEEVGANSSASAVVVGNLSAGKILLGSIARETVWLVTISSGAAGLSSLGASEDAQLSDGLGRNQTGGLVESLQVRADGTANGRRAALIKIPVSAADRTNHKSFYLDLEVASTSATNSAQAHVYGITDNSWTEDAATWAGQTSFLRQNVGNGSQISNNVVLNTGATPVAQMLGQLIAFTNVPTRTAVDVTEFVKSQTNGFASFLVLQDHRWDYSAGPVTNRITGDLQAAGILVTSRAKNGSGPRLLGVSTAPSTNPPVILANPSDRYLDIGGSATLTVSVDQSLSSTIQWMKDGLVIPGATGTTLTLVNVSGVDAGVYTAVVTNAYGTTTSGEAKLAINALPMLTRPLNNAVATIGDPVLLSADFVGYPPPTYTWRKNGTLIAGASGSSYSFLAAADSGGTYSITADNGLGTASSSAMVTLEAAASGLLSISSTNASITENFDTLGKSTTNGVDTTNYLGWTNGAGWLGVDGWTNKPGWYAVTDDNRSPFEGYRSLNYGNGNPSTPPPRGESGLASMGSASSFRERALGAIPWTNNRVFFGMRLSNATGVPLQGFSVRYRMEQYSATTAALSGTKLILAAAVNPISLRSTNFINFGTNAQIVTRSSSYGRIDGTSSGNNALRTNAVTGLGIAPGDSVWVRWEISSSTTNPLAFAIDDLTITNFTPATPPVITNPPVGLTNILGQKATFTVAVSGGPTPALQWLKNGEAIPGATNPSLTMDHVAGSEAGDYSVQAVNVAGSVTSAAVPLVVNTPPQFLLHPLGQTVKEGASVNLTASAGGSPAPAYQWQKDGQDILGATGPSLNLLNVSASDSGYYSVLAANAAGSDSSDLVLLSVLPVTFAGEFGGVAPESDPDGDGISALLEYSFGGATNRNDQDRMPMAAYSNNELSLTYLARTNDTNLSIFPQRTTDLSSTNGWTNGGITVSNLGTTNIGGTDFERRKAVLPTTNNARQFLRLKIQAN